MGKLMRKLAAAAPVACVAVYAIAPGAASAASEIRVCATTGAAAPSTVYAGNKYDLKVATQRVKFYSSNTSVASVSLTTGRMKAVASGTVKITAIISSSRLLGISTLSPQIAPTEQRKSL